MRNPRERLVRHVQELERLEEAKREAADRLRDAYKAAGDNGFDVGTIKVVLRLRRMTPAQRQEKRALEAIYMAALGMLEGEPLPDEARRRLDDRPPPPRPPPAEESPGRTSTDAKPAPPPEPAPGQIPMELKDPAEARAEGSAAAAAGKRIYDNPYPAGDPCRAAWDEGWCAKKKSHGMETPAAYQRRTAKKPDAEEDADEKGAS